MISKSELLKELSDFARKQLERKKKFALVNNGVEPEGEKIEDSVDDTESEISSSNIEETRKFISSKKTSQKRK